jgi:hypothetical protein
LLVDRILVGLLNEGFTDFVRVGSLRKIHKGVLDYTLHSDSDKDALAELRTMLRDDNLSAKDRRSIQHSIEGIFEK